MGGKAAMKFAVTNPSLVNKLIVVDIAPKQYPLHHQQILEAFYKVDIKTLTSRKEADEQMSTIFEDAIVRQFLLKNLKRNDDKTFGWKINLDVLRDEIANIGEALVSGEQFSGKTLFISGNQSGYIIDGDKSLINQHFQSSKIEHLNCGHWVHAEKPIEFLELVEEFLK